MKKIICSFIYAIFFGIIIVLLSIVLNDHRYTAFAHFVGGFILTLPAAIMTTLILHAHYKYYEKRFFRLPERNK